MKYKLTMNSEEFGKETFEYDTLKEAYQGLSRIAAKAAMLNDGVERSYRVKRVKVSKRQAPSANSYIDLKDAMSALLKAADTVKREGRDNNSDALIAMASEVHGLMNIQSPFEPLFPGGKAPNPELAKLLLNNKDDT